MTSRTVFLFLGLFASAHLALAQAKPTDDGARTVTIESGQAWKDTGIDVSEGESLTLAAVSQPESANNCSPDGSATVDSGTAPLKTAPAGALIGRISDHGEPFLVGARLELAYRQAGRLFLRANTDKKDNCSFQVTISKGGSEPPSASMRQKLSSAAQLWVKGQFGSGKQETQKTGAMATESMTDSTTSAGPGLKLPSVLLDADLRQHIDTLPRRVHDHAGNLGDMVNFVIVGSQERMQAALEGATWHVADVDSKEAGLKAVLQTYQKKDYLEMPMSHLFLFDRMQDFGYEQAQAFSVVASRHHFRIWKAPFTWNGEIVWVGAGTHDIGFEKDIRTGKLTHKIDPDVDVERENIATSLEKSGKTKGMTYYTPPNPVQEAKNASGGSYHSDGRVLVVFLK